MKTIRLLVAALIVVLSHGVAHNAWAYRAVYRPATALPQELVGTWEEQLNGEPILHTFYANGTHEIRSGITGGVKSHQAQWNGFQLQLLNGSYQVLPYNGKLYLRNQFEQRVLTPSRLGNPGVVNAGINNAIPRQLVGTWMEQTMDQDGEALFVYIVAANGTYDMIDYRRTFPNGNFDRPVAQLSQIAGLGQRTVVWNSAAATLTLAPNEAHREGPMSITSLSADGRTLVMNENGRQRIWVKNS